MKKIILILLLLIPFKVSASICVMDMDSKRLLYEVNSDKKLLIASTTKILTSLVVINNVSNLNEIIEVDESVLKSYGSNIYIEVGEKLRVIDLLYGLMLRSGNDAATLLAYHVGGSIEGFSLLMNEYAKSIGMNDSIFYNPTGLDDQTKGNTSTCYDMSILASIAYKNNTLMKIMSTKKYTCKTNYKTYIWYNKNKLLDTYKYTIGGKTGYTKKAYRTLVSMASKDNKNISVVTLREKDDFNVHKTLYENTFNKYKKYKVLSKRVDNKYCLKNNVYLLLTKDEYRRIKTKVVTTNNKYDKIPYVIITLDNKTILKEYVYKCKEDT